MKRKLGFRRLRFFLMSVIGGDRRLPVAGTRIGAGTPNHGSGVDRKLLLFLPKCKYTSISGILRPWGDLDALSGFSPVPRCTAPAWGLIDVNRPVSLNDVGKAMKQSYVRQGPAIMFNQNGTDYPLVAGVYSTRSKALLAFEADENTIFDKVMTGARSPDRVDRVVRQGAMSRRDHHRRRHRHPALADTNLQPEGWRPLHHAWHRRIGRTPNRRARHRALSFSDPRQGYVLVLRAALPPIRKAPGEAQALGECTQGCAGDRCRSDPRLYLPGAGARRHQRLERRRRLARRASRIDAMQHLRSSRSRQPRRSSSSSKST